MPESAARYHEGYCDEEQDGLKDERASHLAQSGLHIRLGPYPLSPGFSVSSMTVELYIICYHDIALALLAIFMPILMGAGVLLEPTLERAQETADKS